MKTWILITIMLGAMQLSVSAQDDVYFVPTKKKAATSVPSSSYSRTYYSGSDRSVDEYNRRTPSGSFYEEIQGDSSDIIDFNGEVGVYPDSLEDYRYTKRMARFDEYSPSEAYWQGYSEGMHDSYSWHSPWYYSSYYPWYDSWYYDPWYYSGWGWSWHWGYYDPWYYRWHYPYSYYGWYDYYYPYHRGWGGRSYSYRNGTGTIDRYGNTSSRGFSSSMASGSSRFNHANNRSVTGHTPAGTISRSRGTTSRSGNFSGSRSSYSGSGTSSSSSSSSRSYSNSGSFSSSRSSSSGGGFSSGGGSFSGGSRSSGGGGGARSGGSRR